MASFKMWPFGTKRATQDAVFKVYRGADKKYRWMLMIDATIVAEGDKAFARKKDCLDVVGLVKAWASHARVEYEP